MGGKYGFVISVLLLFTCLHSTEGNSVSVISIDSAVKSVGSTLVASVDITPTSNYVVAWAVDGANVMQVSYSSSDKRVTCRNFTITQWTCPYNTSGVFTTSITTTPLTAGNHVVQITAIGTPIRSQPFNVTYCGNSTNNGFKKNVPANQAFGDTWNFTCLFDSPNTFHVATCQSNARWSLSTSSCQPAATTADMSTASMRNTVSSAAISTNINLVTTTPAATTTSAGATAFGSFWNGTPLVMLFVSAICNHI